MDIIRDKFLSLGNCCFYGMYKRKYFKDNKSKDYGETHFFDWILTNIDSLIKIIECKNLDEYFNIKNLKIRKVMPYLNIKMRNIYLNSLHDVPTKNGSIQVNLFEKYRRRHLRVVNKLKNEKNLLFLYSKKLSNEEINNITFMLNKIRNGKKWALIQFYYNEQDKELTNKNNIYYFNLNNLILNKNKYNNKPKKRIIYNNIDLKKFFGTCLKIYNNEFNL